MKELNLIFTNKNETLYWFRNIAMTIEFDLDMDAIVDKNQKTIVWNTFKKEKLSLWKRLFKKPKCEPVSLKVNFVNMNTTNELDGVLIPKDVDLDFIINLIDSEAKND